MKVRIHKQIAILLGVWFGLLDDLKKIIPCSFIYILSTTEQGGFFVYYMKNRKYDGKKFQKN